MKKSFLLITYHLTIIAFSYGQNLVQNGDFEQYTSCPTNQAQLDSVLFWVNPTASGTPDFYHVCCPNTLVSVPYHAAGGGWQFPQSGDSYVGLFIYREFSGGPYDNIREYIQTQLTSTLVAGNCYHFEMYVNLSNRCNYTSDDIGVYFSDTAISEYTAPVDSLLLPFTPQINNPNGILMDTLNWTLVSGNYVAQGGENFLIIGNFKHDSSTTAIVVNNNNWAFDNAYFYIEDVSLTLCTAIEEQNQNEAIKIYPNPVGEWLNVQYSMFNVQNKKAEIKITDVLGKEIYRNQFLTSDLRLPTSGFKPGIYFIEINDGNIFRKKFLKVN